MSCGTLLVDHTLHVSLSVMFLTGTHEYTKRIVIDIGINMTYLECWDSPHTFARSLSGNSGIFRYIASVIYF